MGLLRDNGRPLSKRGLACRNYGCPISANSVPAAPWAAAFGADENAATAGGA